MVLLRWRIGNRLGERLLAGHGLVVNRGILLHHLATHGLRGNRRHRRSLQGRWLVMADLIHYTVIMTVHYRLSLLRLCRGRAERVFEGPDESRLRRCRGARCGSHGRRRRQRPRRRRSCR